MKNANNSFLICFTLGIFFLMLLNHANAEDEEQPRKNDNLSPFESWRSANFCMKNRSSACDGKANYTITLSGMMNVQNSDIKDFCTGGCYDHTLLVLKCVQDVKRDFHFASKAHVSFVKNVAVKACSNGLQGFDTKYEQPNSATSLYGRIYMPLVSTLMTTVFIATFSV